MWDNQVMRINLRAAAGVALAALLTLFTVFAMTGAANASTIDTCGDNSLCLFHWVNENTAGGVWRSSIGNIDVNHNGCLNLTSTTNYDNGSGPVYDTEGSVVVNDAYTGRSVTYVRLYYWANCNNSGGYLQVAFINPGDYVITNTLASPSDWTQNFVNRGSGYYQHVASVGTD